MDVAGETGLVREEEVMKMPASSKAKDGSKHAQFSLNGNETILIGDSPAAGRDAVAAKRAKDRKGTGFVKPQDLQAEDFSEEEEEEEEEEKDKEGADAARTGKPYVSFEAGAGPVEDVGKVRSAGRKPTGAVTKDKLMQAMLEEEEDQEEEMDEPEGEAATNVPSTVNPQPNGAAVAPAPPPKGTRMGAGWVRAAKQKLSGQPK